MFSVNDLHMAGRQSNRMDCPFLCASAGKAASLMVESWHHCHTHPLVATGAELAGLSDSDPLGSLTHPHKGRAPANSSGTLKQTPFRVLPHGLLQL